MKLQSISIGGLRVDVHSSEEIMLELCRIVKEKRKAVFAYVNAHAYNLASDLPWFRNFIEAADVVVADGQGIRLASWFAGKPVPPHLPLSSWIWEIMQTCQEKHFTVYLLGGQSEVVNAAARNLLLRFPELNLAGVHDGYFERRGAESEGVVRIINNLAPDILIVGFGMPLQEEWIANTLHDLNVHVIIPVGGCFDVLAGKRLQVPAFIRSIGLEWAWRLAQEPRRLLKRYIFGNPKFIWRVVRESVKH